MRVLWISHECSLQDRADNQGLVSRHESAIIDSGIVNQACFAVTYRADRAHNEKKVRNNITYYPVNADLGVGISEDEWEKAKNELLRIIDDFKPDVIQCFGAEWPYGRIAEVTPIPVVIHMMGFLNIYYPLVDMVHARPCMDEDKAKIKEPLYIRVRRAMTRVTQKPDTIVQLQKFCAETERRTMAVNRFFFGRTEWDRNIVKYYSPGSEYFHVEEIVKPSIYAAAGAWNLCRDGKLRLFTCSSADDRKGNEIILRTAKILKELLKIDFVWKVAGSKEFFPTFERRTGIKSEDVNVELIGYVNDSVIIEELSKAVFFIHPSIIDNSPHSVCEAQLIGCPVIASNVGGLPQLVSDGETGWLYPYNEPHSLAFLIGNLREDRNLLEEVSLRETETALRRHDPKRITEELMRIYERIRIY